MKQRSQGRTLRWLAFISILLNVIFNGIYSRVLNVPSIGDVTSNYPTYFSPASYAFSIWFVIYSAFIVYGIIQLLPSQRNHTIYGQLSIGVITTNLLFMAWITAYTHFYLGISNLILVCTFIVSMYMFIKAHRAVLYQNYNLWLQLPFCLLSAWLLVAVMAGFAVYLKSQAVTFYFGEGVMTILMILLATVIGLIVHLRTSSLVFPSVIAWALLAIHSARKDDAAAIAEVAMSCAILLPVVSLTVSVFRKVKTEERIHPSH
jgi:benzodiazapine receptor